MYYDEDALEDLELLMMVLIDFVTSNLAAASHEYYLNLAWFLLKIFTVVVCFTSCGIEFHFMELST